MGNQGGNDGNAGNQWMNAGNQGENATNWLGMQKTVGRNEGIRVRILYRSPIDELELWRGIEIKRNARIYINIDLTLLCKS